jgi:hypothetical protein
VKKDSRSFLLSSIGLMLRPIISFCISRGVRFQDFTQLAKRLFASAAEEDLRKRGDEVSISKISVMTGLQRPEVNRLRKGLEQDTSKDLIVRIVGQWVADQTFLDKLKKPKKLSTDGDRSDFAKLVKTVSKDLNPHTVRFELERLGIIKQQGNFAALVASAYLSKGDPEQTLKFAAEDVRDLLTAAEQNAFLQQQTPNLHAKTHYDNVSDESLPEIRRWFLTLGEKIHAECRQFLSKFDRDINSNLKKGNGRNRIVLGTFSLTGSYSPEKKPIIKKKKEGS